MHCNGKGGNSVWLLFPASGRLILKYGLPINKECPRNVTFTVVKWLWVQSNCRKAWPWKNKDFVVVACLQSAHYNRTKAHAEQKGLNVRTIEQFPSEIKLSPEILFLYRVVVLQRTMKGFGPVFSQGFSSLLSHSCCLWSQFAPDSHKRLCACIKCSMWYGKKGLKEQKQINEVCSRNDLVGEVWGWEI